MTPLTAFNDPKQLRLDLDLTIQELRRVEAWKRDHIIAISALNKRIGALHRREETIRKCAERAGVTL